MATFLLSTLKYALVALVFLILAIFGGFIGVKLRKAKDRKAANATEVTAKDA